MHEELTRGVDGFDLTIIVDWSAAQGRKPEPEEDRCWLAWGTAAARSEPIYAPTRLEAEDLIHRIIADHRGARTLLGIDAAIGFAAGEDGVPVLPVGRELIALLASRISDDRSGVNNRFEVADQLNREIMARTGAASGPFWGRPGDLRLSDLPPTRPDHDGVHKLRACEVAARRATKTKPKSAWQLAGAGSVGSQALMAAPMIHRLLTNDSLSARARLWPFDEATDGDALVIAEVYPSMHRPRAPSYWFRDARQVCDTRDGLMEQPPSLRVDEPLAAIEGWILGVPAIGAARA